VWVIMLEEGYKYTDWGTGVDPNYVSGYATCRRFLEIVDYFSSLIYTSACGSLAHVLVITALVYEALVEESCVIAVLFDPPHN